MPVLGCKNAKTSAKSPKKSASGGKTSQNTIKLLILLIIAPKARIFLGYEKLNYKNPPPLVIPKSATKGGGILNIVSPDKSVRTWLLSGLSGPFYFYA